MARYKKLQIIQDYNYKIPQAISRLYNNNLACLSSRILQENFHAFVAKKYSTKESPLSSLILY